MTGEGVAAGRDPVAGEAVRWLSESEQRVWRALLCVHARVSDQLESELKAHHGLSLADYDVLVALSEAPGGRLRMAGLADRLLISRSGITRRVDQLARRGLVQRLPCPGDRRGTLTALSPAGLAALREAAPTHVRGVRRYLLDPLMSAGTDAGGDLSGLEGLTAALTRIEAALGDDPSGAGGAAGGADETAGGADETAGTSGALRR